MTGIADVRSPGAVDVVVAEGWTRSAASTLSGANAGLTTYGKTWLLSEEEFDAIIGVIIFRLISFHFEESVGR